jgi:hypothetical protein
MVERKKDWFLEESRNRSVAMREGCALDGTDRFLVE